MKRMSKERRKDMSGGKVTDEGKEREKEEKE